MVWIDRVTVCWELFQEQRWYDIAAFTDFWYQQTARIGRQHIVLGTSASNRVTISNCEIDGVSDYSATCDGQHYWGIYLDGSGDLVTLKGNYIHHTSGRSPKVQGNTVLHAVSFPNYYFQLIIERSPIITSDWIIEQ